MSSKNGIGEPPRDLEPPTDPAELPLERVEAELCTLAGRSAAATSRFLALLADFDARDGWAGWGVVSCAHWLSWRCGLDLRTAYEQVRVARALHELPRVRAVFAQGRLSYSKVRAISRVATAESEHDLVEAALHCPAAHLERLVRGLRTARRTLDEQDAQRRGVPADAIGGSSRRSGVQWRWGDDGQLVVWGRLAAEDGARLLAGLSRVDEQRRRADAGAPPTDDTDDAGCGQLCSAEHSRASHAGTSGVAPSDLAPALVAVAELACATVEAPVHAPAADLVVHVDADVLVDSAAGVGLKTPVREGRLDEGPALHAEVLRMLACDGRIRLSVHGVDGRTVALGRRRRRPSRRQLDALWRRDRGCKAPGCGRTRFLHAHHVQAWAAGGRTDLDNLVLLCGEHHRLLHEGGFGIVALGKQRFRFHGPGGAVRPQAPSVSGRLADMTQAFPGIEPGTIEPDWDGSPLHLAHATDVYLTSWRAREVRRGA